VIELLKQMRSQIPDIALRTTFIVGFPGETEKEFNSLVSFIKDYKFNWMGVFPYSREEDTPAYNYANQVSEPIKKLRVNKLMSIQQEITAELNNNLINKMLTVLVEGISEANQELFYGRTQYQAPEVDGITYFTTTIQPQVGEFVNVKITHVDNYDLIGEMVP
ncbi:MAG: TRAM domain-containing protein, partial [Bacillota bacterium]|nr:TRAM domain-containing protein [Bacillota bacterium]